ncbi:hypothetical protein CGLO_11132 [Colletotrichum gloeosporioides Cg-14]|uniref:Uncharacterized protein n=1 Tax=Colletotrichum gloeosporioides (strain Cg-14) TaxID=1237896 RepID=T0LMS1_COLGC|nr:hypothetical protein CGLO_11132 [Colletotrichum gloeosporioides Cg-14]
MTIVEAIDLRFPRASKGVAAGGYYLLYRATYNSDHSLDLLYTPPFRNRTPALYDMLRAITRRPGDKLHSHQEEVLRKQDVVYVAGNGSDESTAFNYPAYVSLGGTTIIVMQFIAPRDQIASQFKQTRIAVAS